VHREQIVKWDRKPTRYNSQMFIINTFSICFGHHYAHLQENKMCVTARGVLRWFCWMWLVAVVGRCVVGCEHCRTVTLTVLTPYNAAPHNHYQPHQAEPVQHTTCSNTRLVLLKMGIMMPETCWESIDNKLLTVASCWFSISLRKGWRVRAGEYNFSYGTGNEKQQLGTGYFVHHRIVSTVRE